MKKSIILFLSPHQFILILIIALITANPVFARTWTSADDEAKTFVADFKSYDKKTGMVKVNKGLRTMIFHIDKLSESDRQWIKKKAEAKQIKFLVWNVQKGSNPYEKGPEKTLKVIQDSKAEIILMQESYDIKGSRPKLGKWIADQLKWNYYQGKSAHLCVISKFPIEKTYYHSSWNGVGARLKTTSGDIVVWSCWLDYKANLKRYVYNTENPTLAGALACETTQSSRAKQTKSLFSSFKKHSHLDADVPVIIGGDWNSPSHLDYTEANKHLNKGLVIPIPSSVIFEENGFLDAYREFYPDVVKHPGNTWSPLYQRVEDEQRIDRLYFKSTRSKKITVNSVEILPKQLENKSIPSAKRNFPSDHAGLLVTLEW